MRRACGWTLIETLVVLVIVALLLALAVPALLRSRDAARGAVCLTRLHNLHVATRIYADTHHTLPLAMPGDVIPALDLEERLWWCPLDRRAGGSSYTYCAVIYMDPPPEGIILERMNPVAGYRRFEANPLLPLFRDNAARHGGLMNVVEWSGAAMPWR